MADRINRIITKVSEKIDRLIEAKDYYEAHQLYRSLYFRCIGQERYTELLDVLYKGAELFLDHRQSISGADLAMLFVDTLIKSDTHEFNEWIPKITKLFGKIDQTTPERESFLMHAIRWSSATASQSSAFAANFGHPLLHQMIAQVYWNEKNYTQARHHYIYSQDGQNCAKLLIEYQRLQGFKCEADLFIAQAVLQYLCLSNKTTADQTFASYTSQHPGINRREPPYLFPLLNFIFFLLQAIESRKLQTFAVLCEQYEPSIKRDPCYVDYLDKIGQIFFGVQPPKKQNVGFFGNFLESLLNGIDDSDDDSDDYGGIANVPSTSRQELLLNLDLD